MSNEIKQSFRVEVALTDFVTLIKTNRPKIQAIGLKYVEGANMPMIVKIESADEDSALAAFIVAANKDLTEAESLRKAYTSVLDNISKHEMAVEKALKDKIERARALRNDYATAEVNKVRIAQQAIEKEKQYKEYEIGIGKEISLSIQLGVAKKITDLDEFFAVNFDNLTIGKEDQLLKQMQGFRPALKQDFFETLFKASYNKAIMSDVQYNSLIARAKAFYTFDKINSEYIKSANETTAKWIAKMPDRIMELKKIQAGDEKIKQLAEERMKNDAIKRDETKQILESKIVNDATEEANKESLSNEFTAQVQSQSIEEQSGTIKRRSYYLMPATEKDFIKLAGLISKVMINVLTEQNKEKTIYKLDKDKLIKRDEKGNPIYVDGIAYWLGEAAKLGYELKIDGLFSVENVIAVNRA